MLQHGFLILTSHEYKYSKRRTKLPRCVKFNALANYTHVY